MRSTHPINSFPKGTKQSYDRAVQAWEESPSQLNAFAAEEELSYNVTTYRNPLLTALSMHSNVRLRTTSTLRWSPTRVLNPT